MMASATGKYSPEWVNAAKGQVSREVFVSEEIYRLEMERLFAWSWVFLAHTTEIPEPGDYVVRSLAGAPVIAIRDKDGAINVLLNSCRHRGTELCRAHSGRAQSFVCPYHGWSYERNGRLITTCFDQHFPEEFDRSSLSLVRVPNVSIYKGLVFGCWDPNAIGLDAFLGDFAWYLDAFFARTPRGMKVLAPPHRWHVKANWKVGALNFVGDSQHIPYTHIGPISLDPVRSARTGVLRAAEKSLQIFTKEGHGCTLSYLAEGLPQDAYQTHSPALEFYYAQVLDTERIEMLRHLRVGVGTVFPNFSFIENQVAPAQKAVIMRQWQPISATEMEVMSWVLAEDEASSEYKESALARGIHSFGAGGVFEQDDMEVWASCTTASKNPVAQRYPYSFHTALPYIQKPVPDHRWPGVAFQPSDTEVAQLEYMKHWDRLMQPKVTSQPGAERCS